MQTYFNIVFIGIYLIVRRRCMENSVIPEEFKIEYVFFGFGGDEFNRVQ